MRIRIRKKEKGGRGRYRKSDMAYSITSPSLRVLLQPALINHRVLLYRDNDITSIAKSKSIKEIYNSTYYIKKRFKNENKKILINICPLNKFLSFT